MPQSQPSISLHEWNASKLGVSRRHLLLRPTSNGLYAVDLGSTNGTFIDGLPLGINQAKVLKEEDLVTLGRLHVKIKILKRPG